MQLFARYVHARDLDKLVGLYEPAAVFVPEPGASVTGHEAIRGALRDMLALHPKLQLVTIEVHRAGDVALVANEWQLEGTTPDGAAIAQSGKSSVVLRRHSDGAWHLLIDRP
jgi:uncharacterized protein (TIGR02246 family)